MRLTSCRPSAALRPDLCIAYNGAPFVCAAAPGQVNNQNHGPAGKSYNQGNLGKHGQLKAAWTTEQI